MKDEDVKFGSVVQIQAYKHNEQLYRLWDEVTVFEITEDYIVLAGENVLITEINGRKWRTNGLAFWFFFKNSWFNIICIFKNQEINYYCNLASPFTFEDQVVKYTDYDLDIKVYKDGSYKILDLKDFNRNRLLYKYSRETVEKIWENVDILKKQIKLKTLCFNYDFIKEMFDRYYKK